MITKTQIITEALHYCLASVNYLSTGITSYQPQSVKLFRRNLIGAEQAGFRSGYSTLDRIFSLKCITNIYSSKNIRLFTAFIDHCKAFDNIWRIGLWRKLLQHNIIGKIVYVIFNLYSQVKSCVKMGIDSQTFFSGCDVGARQDENLSPLLFFIFLNFVGSLRDRVVACSASDRQGSNFESCVWRTVSSHSSHHP